MYLVSFDTRLESGSLILIGRIHRNVSDDRSIVDSKLYGYVYSSYSGPQNCVRLGSFYNSFRKNIFTFSFRKCGSKNLFTDLAD